MICCFHRCDSHLFVSSQYQRNLLQSLLRRPIRFLWRRKPSCFCREPPTPSHHATDNRGQGHPERTGWDVRFDPILLHTRGLCRCACKRNNREVQVFAVGKWSQGIGVLGEQLLVGHDTVFGLGGVGHARHGRLQICRGFRRRCLVVLLHHDAVLGIRSQHHAVLVSRRPTIQVSAPSVCLLAFDCVHRARSLCLATHTHSHAYTHTVILVPHSSPSSALPLSLVLLQ